MNKVTRVTVGYRPVATRLPCCPVVGIGFPPGPWQDAGLAGCGFKANSKIHALPSPAMTTPSGWKPRPGPTRGDQARRVPRGAEGWPPDEADPRRQVPRGTGPVAGRDWDD